MTKEHIIGDLYIKNYELFLAHQQIIQDKKDLEKEIRDLETIIKTYQNISEPKSSGSSLDEVAYGDLESNVSTKQT